MEGPSLASPPLATSASGERRQCRFFEYTSLITEQDYEQAPSPVANQGRPRLCSRTYSLPVPIALSDFKSHFGIQCPYNPKEDDPSFIPNGPSRFNVKLPSFTRRRRSTIGSGPPLRSCLKSSSSSRPEYSRAPPSSASTASSSSTFNPIYCPALARITSSPSSLPNTPVAPGAALGHTSSRASTSTAASTSTSAGTAAKAGVALRPLVIPQIAPDELPEDLEPLSPCCDRCYDAVEYAECTPAHKYTEKWSQAALKKRERDERLALQRGKRQEAKPKPAWCQRLADLVDELPPVPEGVDELEMCKKRRARKEKESHAELDAEEAADEQNAERKVGPPPCVEASAPLETVKEEERPTAQATSVTSSAPAAEEDETSSRDSFASERSATTDAKSPASSAASSLTSDAGFVAKPMAISAASSTPADTGMHAGSPPCRMASLRPVSSAQSAPHNSADSLTEAYKSADRHMEPAASATLAKVGGKKEKVGSWGRMFGRSFGI